MPDKADFEVGDMVILAGPPNAKPLPNQYEITKVNSKDIFRVKDQKGVTMLVHRTRIIKSVGSQKPKDTIEAKQPTIAKAAKAEKKPTTTRAKEKQKMSTAAAPAKPKVEKKEKEVVKPEAFDIAGWIKEHGGVHLSKTSKFDHANYSLSSHVSIDEKGGYYYTINTYEIGGVITLGKTGKGGNQYPLKGRRINQKIKQKNGNTATRSIKGELTAEEVIKKFEKNGYIKK